MYLHGEFLLYEKCINGKYNVHHKWKIQNIEKIVLDHVSRIAYEINRQ